MVRKAGLPPLEWSSRGSSIRTQEKPYDPAGNRADQVQQVLDAVESLAAGCRAWSFSAKPKYGLQTRLAGTHFHLTAYDR
jgi:hypothetical protein